MKTEGQINKMLRETLSLYFMYEKEGQHDLALRILRLGSSLADSALTASGVRAKDVYYTLCTTCGVKHKEWLNRQSIHKSGECLSCLHTRGELYE